MKPKDIAAEAADKIYERYINAKEWTKSGELTQGEFNEMMRATIQSAIEKAIALHDHELICTAARRTNESRAARASEPEDHPPYFPHRDMDLEK